ncbi:aminoglycoside phosphotransferase [Thalassotalea insulae]|uniref:Aminoglycoside phosphotransferase n=1 Tax=Thalassotalea insulae TaxID=2056778 RepID=A0ABQ6GUJ1_9GAMM|nr:aminoglycoside phosphotransferase family protein [Thalassotalea insulae]GLX77826.1 aminoglycoside phosphotransferase [Thalassotalea insulae]
MSKVIDPQQINKVLAFYNYSLSNSKIAPLGNGLINCTYLVRSEDFNFVLQRINHHVFKQPADVIANAELINQHLQQKKAQALYPLEPIWQLNTNDGRVQVTEGENTWRAIQFIPNCYTLETVANAKQAYQVAQAFGQFTAALSDFPADKLTEIIPQFHHLDFRLAQLQTAVSEDAKGRLSQCQSLVDFCFSQQTFIKHIAELEQVLPLQVTHNDTKINNLLFSSETNAPIAVIDLDTCMPGFVMHDFGDMVRTCCCNLPEDGTDLAKMTVRLDIFTALAQGYVDSLAGTMNSLEQQSLITGAQLLPFMIGIRFLTDFIEGDHYFHTAHPLHNLQRAKNQLHFFKLLHDIEPQLSKIVKKL